LGELGSFLNEDEEERVGREEREEEQ